MRRLLAILFVILAAWPALAQDGPGSIVTRQFEAFRADDMPQAFSYASPMIQGYFQTPENFGSMVTQGYPMVRNPGEVKLLDLREEGGRTVQRVQVFDGKGVPYILDYEMIETENGWKINGVRFVDAPPLSA